MKTVVIRATNVGNKISESKWINFVTDLTMGVSLYSVDVITSTDTLLVDSVCVVSNLPDTQINNLAQDVLALKKTYYVDNLYWSEGVPRDVDDYLKS